MPISSPQLVARHELRVGVPAAPIHRGLAPFGDDHFEIFAGNDQRTVLGRRPSCGRPSDRSPHRLGRLRRASAIADTQVNAIARTVLFLSSMIGLLLIEWCRGDWKRINETQTKPPWQRQRPNPKLCWFYRSAALHFCNATEAFDPSSRTLSRTSAKDAGCAKTLLVIGAGSSGRRFLIVGSLRTNSRNPAIVMWRWTKA